MGQAMFQAIRKYESHTLVVAGKWLKYLMRFYEIQTIKPIKPLSPEQARVAALKKNIASAKQRLRSEKGRQLIKPIKSVGSAS